MLAMLIMNRMATKRRRALSQKAAKPVKNVSTEDNQVSPDFCRTCLNTATLVPIFYNKDTEEKKTEDLRLATGLEIKRNDGLSQKICSQCIETVNLILQFRRTSKKAEKTLLSMITGTKPKKKSSKLQKKLKSQSQKAAVNKVDFDDYDFTYEVYTDDFQNDLDYNIVKQEEVEHKVKQKPTKKPRMVLPTASSYKCNTCNKEFRMKATYKAHMRFHTNYCVCESCGKRCRNNNQLQEHKRARHGLGRIHKCAYCEYSSATKEALTIHERRHTGERPYICDHCGATFHRRSNLVQHIAIHLPEKNFQCPHCPRREKSKKFLAIHRYKAHRESKYKYICPICQDSFTRPSNVRLHMTRAHLVPRDEQGLIQRLEIVPPILAENIQYETANLYLTLNPNQI